MRLVKNIIFLLLINLGSLALGSFLMNNGPRSDWYINLNRAPWTPPGWVFGTAWTTIMICFSIYLAFLFIRNNSSKAKTAFIIQIILNIGWNFVFFNQKQFLLGFIVLLLLNVVLYYFFFTLKERVEKIRLLLLPYIIWMAIATSLNLYVLIHN